MTDKTDTTAHAEITAPISADLRRIDDAGTKSAPITLMTEDRACTWAWDQVQQDVGTKGWTAGDSCNFYGFFLWGWNYRGQYEAQRLAAPPAPAAVAVPDRFALVPKRLTRAMERVLSADEEGWQWEDLLAAAEAITEEEYAMLAAAPAQEHATQLAGQGQEKCVCTFAQRVVGDGCRHCNPQEYIDRLHKCLDEYREEADTPAQAQEDARDAGGWYLQDTRSYVGNDVVWWAKDSKGYTTDVSNAHVFTQEQAFRQASMRGVDRAWPKEYIDGKTRPAMDMQYIDHDTAIAARAAAQQGTTP